jgi:hypothetical protein
MTSFTKVALVALLSASAGCSYHLISPPARIATLESAAPVKQGETIVGGRGGVAASVFDPGAVLAGGIVRHGIGHGVELDAEGTYAYITTNDSPHIDRNLVTSRVGVKVGNDYVAVTGGLGGGISPAAGGFGAVDGGLIVSYANCYLVPFFSPGVYVSVPVAAKTVTFDNGESSKASTSFGFGASAGLEIPLDHARCHEGHTVARLQLGVNALRIESTDYTVTNADGSTTKTGDYGTAGALLGFEIPINL